ncbi:MAG: hypothetical protein B0A82_26865 [Alkalinema sp. CACIAM 70d]|nr:MAG: hypothetical protein B0A82_26865 [Alkalinema sp. CACIAM 70d]
MQRNFQGFREVLQLRGSVLPIVLPRVVIFGIFSSSVAWLFQRDLPIDLTVLGLLTENVVCNLVLGLLLVFRTNTAYDRFWEGRKAWGDLVTNVRNLVRLLRTNLISLEGDAKAERDRILQSLSTFLICTKLSLQKGNLEELKSTLNHQLGFHHLTIEPTTIVKLKAAKNPPLEILLWVSIYLQKACEQGHIDSSQRSEMNALVNQLVASLTVCERIQATPMPAAYMTCLKSLTLMYCLLIPFALVEQLGGWTGLATGVISFVLLYVEAIGAEIEDPFGNDVNDLPLNEICQSIVDMVNDAIVTRPYQVPVSPQPISELSSELSVASQSVNNGVVSPPQSSTNLSPNRSTPLAPVIQTDLPAV